MIHFLRHQQQLLQISLQIVNYSIEKETWKQINDEETVAFYQEKINKLEQRKEVYLNQLLRSLNKTELTEHTVLEMKKTYELVEQYSTHIKSSLFTMHLDKTIENYQKKYGDYLLRNQLKKAHEIEKTISGLERVA